MQKLLIFVIVLVVLLFSADLLGLIEINAIGFFRAIALGEDAHSIIMPGSSSNDGELETENLFGTDLESGPSWWYSLYFSTPQFSEKEETNAHNIKDALISVINGSEVTLDISIFQLDLEEVGDAILAAKKRDVAVRIVTDSDTIEEDDTLMRLYNEKVPMVEDNRSAIMHNKFMVVDGKAVWTGSYNFTHNGTYRNNNNAIYIQSPELAANYGAEFSEQFEDLEFGPASPENTVHPKVWINGTLVETCFAPEDRCGLQIADLLNSAEKSINFMAFSFTDDDLGEIVRKRADEGVLVRGVFETRGSDTEYSEIWNMLNSRLNVYQDGNPYLMHHKVVIIDESIVVMGSFNYSSNANKANDENILIIHNKNIAAEYLKEFERVYELAKTKPYGDD